MPWVLWQHEKHGKALQALYREKYDINADKEEEEEGAQGGDEEEDGEEERAQGEGEGEGENEGDADDQEEGGMKKCRSVTLNRKFHLAKEYYAGLDEEERVKLQKLRDDAYQEKFVVHERTAWGDTACSAEELAE
jgi:hypothetical protein